MEILQFLLSFFLSEYGEKNNLSPLLNLFQENGFDIKKTIKNIKPEMLLPIVKEFFSSKATKNPTENYSRENSLNPISNIADKEIIYTLNKYFLES